MQIKTVFPFKGSRQYVPGTSIFNAFVNTAKFAGQATGSIDILFKKIVLNPDCIIQVRASEPDDSAVAKVTGQDGSNVTFCLIQAKTMGEVSRVEYDDEVLCDAAVIDGNSISAKSSAHTDEIELLIAHCKKLHQTYFATDKKWIFSRYVGRFPLELSGEVTLSIVKNIGTKLTCSDVFCEGRKVGEIYFS